MPGRGEAGSERGSVSECSSAALGSWGITLTLTEEEMYGGVEQKL